VFLCVFLFAFGPLLLFVLFSMSAHPETEEQFSSPVTRGEIEYKSVGEVICLMTDEERAKEEEEKEKKGKKEKGEKEKGDKGKGGKKEKGEKEKGEKKTQEERTNRKRTHSEISSPPSAPDPSLNDASIVTIKCSELYPEASDAIVTIQLVSSPCECKRPTKVPKIMSIALEGMREKKDPPKLCNSCGMSPCIVIAEQHAIKNPGSGSNKQKRFELYSFFSKVVFKYRARKILPPCLEAAIKAEWPDTGQKYVGFK
jgi:hypothetical protein